MKTISVKFDEDLTTNYDGFDNILEVIGLLDLVKQQILNAQNELVEALECQVDNA